MFAFDLFVDFKIVGTNEGAALYLIKSRWWQTAAPNTIFMKVRFMPVTFKHSGGPCNLHNPFVHSAKEWWMERLHFYLHHFLICTTSFSSGCLLHLSETLYKPKKLNKLFCQFAAFESPHPPAIFFSQFLHSPEQQLAGSVCCFKIQCVTCQEDRSATK